MPQLFKLFWQYVKEQYFPLRRKKSKEEDRDIDLILQGSLTPTADGPAQTVCDESEFSCPEDETMTRIRVEFDEVDLGATTTAPEVEFEICGISECASPTPSTATPRTPLSKSPSFFGAPPTMNQAAHNAAATMKKDEDEYGNERADTMLEKSRLQALIKPILLTVVLLGPARRSNSQPTRGSAISRCSAHHRTWMLPRQRWEAVSGGVCKCGQGCELTLVPLLARVDDQVGSLAFQTEVPAELANDLPRHAFWDAQCK